MVAPCLYGELFIFLFYNHASILEDTVSSIKTMFILFTTLELSGELFFVEGQGNIDMANKVLQSLVCSLVFCSTGILLSYTSSVTTTRLLGQINDLNNTVKKNGLYQVAMVHELR